MISAAIITFNEENRIRDCLASVHDWCDEIVVLDSHSTDRTREICASFPRVVFAEHDFDGHIQQKNRAIDLTKGDWILSIDADERVTPELAASIQKFVLENPNADGARIPRLTVHLGRPIRHGGWYIARYRLIRRGRGAWGGENPHDLILLKDRPPWKQNLGPVLKGNLIHYSFTDLSDQINTINRFSSIVAFTRSGHGRKFSILKLIYKAPLKFIEQYIMKLGFLDGVPGFIVAASGAFSTFLKWAKMYELEKTGLERPSNLRKDYQVQKKK